MSLQKEEERETRGRDLRERKRRDIHTIGCTNREREGKGKIDVVRTRQTRKGNWCVLPELGRASGSGQIGQNGQGIHTIY